MASSLWQILCNFHFTMAAGNSGKCGRPIADTLGLGASLNSHLVFLLCRLWKIWPASWTFGVTSLLTRMSSDGEIPPMPTPTYGKILGLADKAFGCHWMRIFLDQILRNMHHIGPNISRPTAASERQSHSFKFLRDFFGHRWVVGVFFHLVNPIPLSSWQFHANFRKW